MNRVADSFTHGFDPDVVSAWIADDPDPATAQELTELLEATHESGEAASQAVAELTERFAGPLVFGTAGLRGQLGGGPNRMNRAVVIRAAAGLAEFLREAVGPDFTMVIGHDARYGSADFARDTAAVVTGAGGRALLLPDNLPTPLLAFATHHLHADAGVMVTASHNPPRDNGYKVYLGQRPQAAVYDSRGENPAKAAAGAGAQIVPPFDGLIAGKIAQVPSAASVARPESGWEQVGTDIVDAYLDSLRAVIDAAMPNGQEAAQLTVVHTSMHGVGHETALRALELTGVAEVHPVAEQAQPDPAFPTVAFPNPEEPGALDLAFAAAERAGAELILANDPDADRLAVAIPVGESGYRQLTGDEVGILLGEAIAARTAGTPGAVLASSVVSSRALSAVAEAHGLNHRITLTGFKWISRGTDLVFGYEEAIGYAVDPQVVRDKDGISAAVLFTVTAARLKAQGMTIADELPAFACATASSSLLR